MQSAGQHLHRLRLAVHQRHRRMAFEVAIPVQQARLAGMRRQTADGVDARADADQQGFARLEAGVPETFFTVWSNVFMRAGRIRPTVRP